MKKEKELGQSAEQNQTEEMKTDGIMKPAREHFNLIAVKIKDSKVYANYDVEYLSNGAVKRSENNNSFPEVPHPEFVAALESLTQYAREVMHMDGKYDDRITVTGIKVAGSGQNEGVIIKTMYKADNGLKTAVNTPIIHFARTAFGFEAEVEEIVLRLKDETYKYIYEDKKGELELWDQQLDDPDFVDGKTSAAGE